MIHMIGNFGIFQLFGYILTTIWLEVASFPVFFFGWGEQTADGLGSTEIGGGLVAWWGLTVLLAYAILPVEKASALGGEPKTSGFHSGT